MRKDTMPLKRPNDSRILDSLADLFRDRGYAGVSLTQISAATGLGRASLYHRFPGGKQQMALEVLRHLHRRVKEEILAPLRGDRGSPVERARRAARQLDAFYQGGKRPCFVDTMSLGDQTPEIRAAVSDSLTALGEAFSSVAREAGHGRSACQRRAQDVLVRIQGALVIARASGDTTPFKRAIRELPRVLVGDTI